jgi:hypothetical protein
MEQNPKIIPTWGYKPDGTAKIFDLEEGETLPEGWSDRPELWHHPNTAHLYKPPAPDWPPPGHAIAGGYQGPYQNVPTLEADDEPPMKPRRGRPPKSETS